MNENENIDTYSPSWLAAEWDVLLMVEHLVRMKASLTAVVWEEGLADNSQ